MGLETDYIEYGVQLSLAVLGISASYLIDFSTPSTLLTLLFLPVLYGYTAYISRESFNKATLTTLITPIFGVVGGITALLIIPYSIGNILVSMLSGGDHFKDFYGSTSIPLLITGLIIGTSIFAYGAANPEFKQDKVDSAATEISKITEETIERTGMLENQKNTQLQSINRTAKAATELTIQKVYNKTDPKRETAEALEEARTEVPETIYQQTQNQFDQKQVDLSNRIKPIFKDMFGGQKFFIIIPLITGLTYSLQPLIGILTGIFGKIFLKFGE